MRNSRWTTKPIEKNGQIVGTKPNVAGDLEILKALGRYSLLTIDDLCAITSRSYTAVAARVNKLKREPNRFIRVADPQCQQARMYHWAKQALQLAPAGVAKLAALGFEARTPRPSEHFIHQLTQSQTSASFETGARLAKLQLFRLPEMPIPVTFPYGGASGKKKLTPDGGPIGLGYGSDIWRFVVFETDCASEPLSSSNKDRQAIELKFSAYLIVLSEALYETHWGVPNLTVLFTTTSATRLQNMHELAATMAGVYLNCFRFFVFPTILSGTVQPKMGWAVTETGLQCP